MFTDAGFRSTAVEGFGGRSRVGVHRQPTGLWAPDGTPSLLEQGAVPGPPLIFPCKLS